MSLQKPGNLRLSDLLLRSKFSKDLGQKQLGMSKVTHLSEFVKFWLEEEKSH